MKNTKITVECEVVTPLFLYGADGQTPEIRIPSLKGMIRYWWRAANADLGLKQLKESENLTFGGVSKESKQENKNKIGKSKVIMRLINYNDKSNTSYLWKELRFSNESSFKQTTEYSGLKYLLYSLLLKNSKQYIKTGTKFNVEFKANNSDDLEKAMIGLLFLQFFGAIGARNRRGAGSIKINSFIENNSNIECINLFDTHSIKDKASLVNRYIELSKLINNTTEKSYSVLKGSRIFVFNYKETWYDALEFIGKKFKYFRDNNRSNIYDVANFGFPIIHRNKTKIIAGKMEKNKLKEIKRRLSPFIFKVIKINENMFFPIVIYLNGNLINDEFRIMKALDKSSKDKLREDKFKKLPKLKSDIIKKFITYLTDGNEYKEITI
ncbi:type III-B CRISPR module RAMP protein Cmr1 [Clostridium sp. CMCC3677]|uniref:type III-B CRISPR module RAMP protein Cmr1 n=1 Tax=Clostridium sp. CMCC3677 TaxID=2949963 RepID=UPI0013F0992C|nr:type III-B CRISPR module RAMP protein Cmr1 [Clostridium sp. CMCC3677]NFG61324.1 type III-B CRISPR module RAMP protein Cmr1 [Clostridium botulinum]NFQ09205.1 type III-B CRISPR module RAMP protein Cmr1 [Clostridium botulinum]